MFWVRFLLRQDWDILSKVNFPIINTTILIMQDQNMSSESKKILLSCH